MESELLTIIFYSKYRQSDLIICIIVLMLFWLQLFIFMLIRYCVMFLSGNNFSGWMWIDLSVHQHSPLLTKDDKLSHIRHGLYQHTSEYEIYCAGLWYWVNTNFLWLCCSGFWYCHFKKIFCLTSKRYPFFLWLINYLLT